jgi:Ni2+-binding GTPase involved in maturation of urease and hydrogenase
MLFDIEPFCSRVARLNHSAIIPISAKTGEGTKEWTDWLR